MEHCEFVYDARLGIALPRLNKEWNELAHQEQESILAHWETIRGRIPDRIWEIEQEIKVKQERLYHEESFVRSCELNSEIADLASCINDLHLWYRVNQEMESGKTHQ